MVSGGNTEDTDLADVLRREDPEQFHTLVRMHLSFVLDLNTDECDGVVEKAGRFRPMKWSFASFAKKSKTPSRSIAEGVCLTHDCISRVYQLIEWLSKEQNVIQEGIFRRSGKMTRQQELKTLLASGSTLPLDDGIFSVHDCASVLKNFLAQLPEPLLTDAHYPAHCQIAELCSGEGDPIEEERLLKVLQLILLLLPPENLQLLRYLIGLLHLTASHANSNKMSSDNLATLFTPHLLCPRKLSPEALHTNAQTMSRVVSFMIKQGPALFHIPGQLATDIRAYWTTREQRKLMPKKDLNESICDGMAAKTVFTFVDRERTAEASASANPTEAALAQLYAHIQSLPESSKKRKLIKQFNKENGQGTPQLVSGSHNSRASRSRHRGVAAGSAKHRQRSRSLGDSIKKHLPGFGKTQKEPKKTGEDVAKDQSESPRSSPASKMKLFFQRNYVEVEPLSAANPGTMPALKKSLLADASSEVRLLRQRLSANSKRTPVESASDRESSAGDGDERGRSYRKRTTPTSSTSNEGSVEDSSAPSKSSRLEPESPFPAPLPPSLDKLPGSLDAQTQQGTFRDESWPVSTAPAPSPACAMVTASSGLPNSNPLITRNVLSWMTSTPAYARACKLDSPLNNCLLTPSNVSGSNSMSPITRSTQKMPKAMQEDMMTPRSRKPVVALSSSNLSQLAHLSGWGRSGCGDLVRSAASRSSLIGEGGLSRKLRLRDESIIEQDTDLSDCDDSVHIPIDKMLAKELPKENDAQTSHVTQGCDCFSPKQSGDSSKESGAIHYCSCSSGGSALTGTFREIVLSRSVLTASPVDLSFSSHTGDFDSSSDRDVRAMLSSENMSESLLFCLDGNEPSCLKGNDSSFYESGRKSSISVAEMQSSIDKQKSDSHYESSGVEADEENNFCSVNSSMTTSNIENEPSETDASDSLLSTGTSSRASLPCAVGDVARRKSESLTLKSFSGTDSIHKTSF